MDSCAVKPPGAFRIVVLGTSIASGWGVPYEQTFVALSARALSQQCGRKVEIQNISTNNNILSVYRRSSDALTLKPDLVVLLFGAGDTHGRFTAVDLANRDNPAFQPVSSVVVLPFLRRMGSFFIRNSRAMLMAKHFLYRDPAFSLKAVTLHPMDVDYMVAPPLEPWKARLADLDVLIGGMADKFRAHGIPFVLLPTVNHPQALLLSSYPNLQGFDPREFEKDLSAIALAHGIAAFNIYDDFTQTRSDLLFYSGDGHPTAEGHAVLSRGFVREVLASGKIPGCLPGSLPLATREHSTNTGRPGVGNVPEKTHAGDE
jgi:lysophospholipase L1-like esterase